MVQKLEFLGLNGSGKSYFAKNYCWMLKKITKEILTSFSKVSILLGFLEQEPIVR